MSFLSRKPSTGNSNTIWLSLEDLDTGNKFLVMQDTYRTSLSVREIPESHLEATIEDYTH